MTLIAPSLQSDFDETLMRKLLQYLIQGLKIYECLPSLLSSCFATWVLLVKSVLSVRLRTRSVKNGTWSKPGTFQTKAGTSRVKTGISWRKNWMNIGKVETSSS